MTKVTIPVLTWAARVERVAIQTITNAAVNFVIFDSANYNELFMWDALIPRRITIMRPGKYRLWAMIHQDEPGPVTAVSGDIRKNGTVIAQTGLRPNAQGADNHFPIVGEDVFVVGDFLELTTSYTGDGFGNPPTLDLFATPASFLAVSLVGRA